MQKDLGAIMKTLGAMVTWGPEFVEKILLSVVVVLVVGLLVLYKELCSYLTTDDIYVKSVRT
jgi:hypothetical protein